MFYDIYEDVLSIRRLTGIYLVFMSFTLLPALTAAEKPQWKTSLEDALRKDIKFSTFDTRDIPQSGTRYRIKLDGLAADAQNMEAPTPNYYYEGAVSANPPGKRGVGKQLLGAVKTGARKGFHGGPHAESTLVKGQIVYFTKLRVMDDKVYVVVVSAQPKQVSTDGTSRDIYYQAAINFVLPNLQSMSAPAVMAKMTELLEPETRQSTTVPPVAPSSTPATSTSLVGKTVKEMTDLLGSGYTTVVVGSRTIYVFKDLGLRVAVEDGKVVSANN